METNTISHFKAGIIASLLLMASFLTLYYTGLTFQETWLNWLPIILYIILIAGFVIIFGRQTATNKFELLFTYGFKSTAIAVILYTIFILIVLYAIPGYKAKLVSLILEGVRAQDNLSGLEKEQAEEKIPTMITVMQLGGSLFRNTIAGAIGAIIGAIIGKFTNKNAG